MSENLYGAETFNGLYIRANGIKLELDVLEATEKVVVIERKEF